MTLLESLKFDLKEAAYRVAGTQILLFAKNKLLTTLRKRGIDNRYGFAINYSWYCGTIFARLQK